MTAPDDIQALIRAIGPVDAIVIVTDADGRVLGANPHALDSAGLAMADLAGRVLADCPWFANLPASRARVLDAVATAASGNIARCDVDLCRAAAAPAGHEFTFLPRYDDARAVREILVTAVDAGLRAKSAVETNLELLNDLGEATRELTNPARILDVTTRMLGEHLGVSRVAYADVADDNDTFTIQHDYTDGCASTVGQYSLELFGKQAASAMRSGRTLVVRDVDAELADGGGVTMFRAIGINAIVCCPLVKYGKLVAMMAVHQTSPRDWTASEIALVENVVERSWATIERARAQLRLEKTERQFEDLFEHAPDAILIVDVLGNVALVNQPAEELFGYARHELIGRPIEQLVPESIRERHVQLREAYMGTPRHGPYVNRDPNLRGRRKDGSEFPAEVTLNPIETEQGPMIATSVRDNTERNRLEAQLQQSLRMETIGQLAGGVAHDFNNVLTVISATAELLLERNGGDGAEREDLATILRACEQAAAVTRQLLALSRQQVLDPVTVDLNDVLQDLEPVLPRLIGAQVAVKFRPAADPVTTRVDRTQIDQVILNLALNARDAMPQGGTLILETSNVKLDRTRIGAHADLEPGPHVVLTVSDTGSGMDEATRRRVFEPFFTTKPPGKGTGLGLSSAYGIVRQSGGSMTVSSEPGKGSTFKIYLPRVAPERKAAAERVDALPPGKETILIVEDEAEIRQVASIMLERRGYTVLAVDSGEAAVDVLRRDNPRVDLVLSDVVMPGSNGPETIRRLRELRPEIRVLYMSGFAADLAARHGPAEDMANFIAKPFTLAELSRAVRSALDR